MNLTLLLNPDAVPALANLVAIAACAADCVAVTVGLASTRSSGVPAARWYLIRWT